LLKNSLKESVFVNSALKHIVKNTLLQYTPTDCFFGYFAHWVTSIVIILISEHIFFVEKLDTIVEKSRKDKKLKYVNA